MPARKLLKKQNDTPKKEHVIMRLLTYGLLALLSFAGTFLFFLKRKPLKQPLKPAQKIDIEIRYDCEKDADATLLAQNIVKIIRMVLMPLESQVKKKTRN